MNHKDGCLCCSCKAKRGEYKGENSPMYGLKRRPPTDETRKKLSEAKKGPKNPMKKQTGEKHFAWKGDEVSYLSLHEWVHNHKPLPADGLCEICHEKKRLYLSNISGNYKRDISDFQWVCCSCHKKYDSNLGKQKHWDDQYKRRKKLDLQAGGGT